MQPRAQAGQPVRHPAPPFLAAAVRPRWLIPAEPRPQQFRCPLLAVAVGDLPERVHARVCQVLDAERAEQHRGGLRVCHGVRYPQRFAE
jgi:hypothetical protein